MRSIWHKRMFCSDLFLLYSAGWWPVLLHVLGLLTIFNLFFSFLLVFLNSCLLSSSICPTRLSIICLVSPIWIESVIRWSSIFLPPSTSALSARLFRKCTKRKTFYLASPSACVSWIGPAAVFWWMESAKDDEGSQSTLHTGALSLLFDMFLSFPGWSLNEKARRVGHDSETIQPSKWTSSFSIGQDNCRKKERSFPTQKLDTVEWLYHTSKLWQQQWQNGSHFLRLLLHAVYFY